MSEQKTINSYTVLKETEKAILINTKLPEIEQNSDLWLPKSKITIGENIITLDADFYQIKLEEIKNQTSSDNLIEITSKFYEKGDKATKLIIDANFNQDNKIELWLFIPNSQIREVKELENSFALFVPEWVYNSSLKSSIEKQLEFYNKEEVKYGHEDFDIISNV